MKLLATVEIFNLELSSFHHKPIQPKCKCKLTIGKKRPRDSHPILVISSNNNRNGSTYQIHENISRIFSTRSEQGMATLRFKSPNHDVLISKTGVVQLKAFLNVLVTSSGNENATSNTHKSNSSSNANFSTLTPFSNKELAKTRMSILSRRDYPITTNFSSSLVHLSINAIRMTKVDLRIFKLKHLQQLDLSNNNIKTIPDEGWDGLTSLVDLNLSTNQITKLPVAFCGSGVMAGLRTLNLACNQLSRVPWKIGNFTSLCNLHLSNNLLSTLPETLSRLKHLQQLHLSHNQLSHLPGGIMGMALHLIDLTFQRETSTTPPPTTPHLPPSLYELSARIVVDNKLSYTDTDTLTQAYLHTHKMCSTCGRACFESVFSYVRPVRMNGIAEVVLQDRQVPVVVSACGLRCHGRMQRGL